MKRLLAAAVGASLALTAQAQASDTKDEFVEINIIATLYHELGHAIIDAMDVPIFGQEEDAADVASALMIDWYFEEDSVQIMMTPSAIGFLHPNEEDMETTYSSSHGSGPQRFYNHLCMLSGANPEERGELAAELGLPPERAEACVWEYAQAAESWDLVFHEMETLDGGKPLVYVPRDDTKDTFAAQIIAKEVAFLNERLSFRESINVTVQYCDEPNAFYIPATNSIVFCAEFTPYLEEVYDAYLGDG